MNRHVTNHGFDTATSAGEETVSVQRKQEGKKKKHEETRASLEGGLLYESNVQLANVVLVKCQTFANCHIKTSAAIHDMEKAVSA